MRMPRRLIDARSPQARDLRLRGAQIGMSGEVLGGRDVLSNNRVSVPEQVSTLAPAKPTFMPDLLAQHKARNAGPKPAQAVRPRIVDSEFDVSTSKGGEKVVAGRYGVGRLKKLPTSGTVAAEKTKFLDPAMAKVSGEGARVKSIADGYRNALKQYGAPESSAPRAMAPAPVADPVDFFRMRRRSGY